MRFLEAVQYCIDRNLIFAAYRLPHSDAVRLIVQKNNTLRKIDVASQLSELRGFVVSPFKECEQNNSYIIEPHLNYISTDYIDFNDLLELPETPLSEAFFDNGVVSKLDFTRQVESIQHAIEEQQFEKAVLSRIKVLERNYRSKLTQIFQMLISSYPNAFIYIFNIQEQLWIGATPEPLLCTNKNELETVSLAGTRQFSADNLNLNNWSRKERIEQQLVTCYIEKILDKFDVLKYQKVGPYTKKAGNLVHLRTDFSLKYNRIGSLTGQLVMELHPTSAVCGLPKQPAMDFILKTEKHNRKYYSGFLGPVNIDERLLLYVNLRCMQVLPDRLVLYVGAGITPDSNPADEWDETELKADTLLSVIHKM